MMKNMMENYFRGFIEYFSGLELPAQILTGVLLVLLLIGVGYLIYVWRRNEKLNTYIKI